MKTLWKSKSGKRLKRHQYMKRLQTEGITKKYRNEWRLIKFSSKNQLGDKPCNFGRGGGGGSMALMFPPLPPLPPGCWSRR